MIFCWSDVDNDDGDDNDDNDDDNDDEDNDDKDKYNDYDGEWLWDNMILVLNMTFIISLIMFVIFLAQICKNKNEE